MKFAENSPPAEVTDAQKDASGKLTNSFDVVVLLENVGEYDVPKGMAAITIGGLSSTDFLAGGTKNNKGVALSLKDKNPESDLSGVKKDPEGNKIPGSLSDVKFEELAYQGVLQGNNEFPIQADLCYAYQTKAAADACIRADATKTTAGVCQIAGSKQVFSAGAPVHVTSVKESVAGRNKILLTFNVKNVGTGNVFKFEGSVACPRDQFAKQDQVQVEVKTGMSGISCSGISKIDGATQPDKGVYVGYLRLSTGEGTFSCIQTTPSEDALKKVDIKLTYNYLTSRSTKILVKHIIS